MDGCWWLGTPDGWLGTLKFPTFVCYAVTRLRHYAVTPLRGYAITRLRRYAVMPLRICYCMFNYTLQNVRKNGIKEETGMKKKRNDCLIPKSIL